MYASTRTEVNKFHIIKRMAVHIHDEHKKVESFLLPSGSKPNYSDLSG